jgi:predicted AlkP superfamily pyrophosphatase or phosphodiesterase
MKCSESARTTALLALSLVSCAPAGSAPGPRPAAPRQPTLLVFLTVDQFTPVYFDRFGSQFTGGLARLLKDGAVFVDAHQDHGITETAPGHASTMSGRFPQHTGITRNLLGVNDDSAPLIGSDELGASPRRFRGTTVTDWLLARDPRTRALSVSMKDRGAILPIGRSKQQVYWYATNGTFTTSSWYAASLPPWVRAFNARHLPQRYAGTAWNLLLDPSLYPEPDSVAVENGGRNFLFPHQFPADSARTASYVRLSPMMDEMTLAFALAGLTALDLGSGPAIDVLAISLSATDVVGHLFGPDSREAHDQVLRLDRAFGAFLDSLFKTRPPESVVIAMTADHGAAAIPELAAQRFPSPPLRVKLGPAFGPALAAVKAAGGDSSAFDFESGAVFIDSTRLGRLGFSRAMELFTDAARTIPGVWRVDRFADLQARVARDPDADPIARRWIHSFPPDMIPAIVVTLTPGSILDYSLPATHGSPHDYDTHVPMIFLGAPFKPGRYQGYVRTVDIGPTLAAALGAAPTEPVDGRALTQALRSPDDH